MTAADPIEFQGEWRQGPGGVLLPVLPATTVPARQSRPATAAHPCQPGFRPTYRTEVCECGCLIALSETCPNCGESP